MPTKDLIRVAIIGFGHWGPNYARILSGTLTGARLVACAETAATRLAAFERQYPSARAYADFRRLLRDGDVDAAIIATPTSTHRGVAEECLNAGVHVLCEKPLTTSWQEYVALRASVRRAGIVLHTVHNWKYSEAFRTARQLVADGTLGALQSISFETARDGYAAASHDNWRVRAALVRKRSSEQSSSRFNTSWQSRRYCWSLPTASAIAPSAVSNS